MILFGLSHPGRVRDLNEDAIFYKSLPSGDTVAVLCDGMGGRNAGEIASATAGEAFMACAEKMLMDSSQDIFTVAARSCDYANFCVFKKSRGSLEYQGMGSTLVGVIVRDTLAAIVSVGDSRCYWYAEHLLQQITMDHSYVQELLSRGEITPEEAKVHPKRSYITRAIGVSSTVQNDVFQIEILPGDALLLCSDGLSNTVSSPDIVASLCEAETVKDAVNDLISKSLKNGAPDNVSAVLIYNPREEAEYGC